MKKKQYDYNGVRVRSSGHNTWIYLDKWELFIKNKNNDSIEVCTTVYEKSCQGIRAELPYILFQEMERLWT